MVKNNYSTQLAKKQKFPTDGPKGKNSQQNKTKRVFLDKWVKTVNNYGGFGKWQWAVSFHPSDLWRAYLNDSVQ